MSEFVAYATIMCLRILFAGILVCLGTTVRVLQKKNGSVLFVNKKNVLKHNTVY